MDAISNRRSFMNRAGCLVGLGIAIFCTLPIEAQNAQTPRQPRSAGPAAPGVIEDLVSANRIALFDRIGVGSVPKFRTLYYVVRSPLQVSHSVLKKASSAFLSSEEMLRPNS
jgi:hypothetical protein